MPPSQTQLQEHDEVVQALSQKRVQLDEEIAEFKAVKQKEYEEFEAHLRHGSTSERGHANKPRESSPRGNGVEQTKPTKKDTVLLEYTETRESSPQQSDDDRHLAPATPTDDMEMAIRSLFTPSYLPLLEDNNRSSRKKNQSSSSSSLKKLSKTPSPLSSFSLPTSIQKSISPQRESSSFSENGQRPFFGERTPSSRSDSSVTSPNLRSSLRQPKSPEQQSQRGQKHVLFHIDNMVISPSSSPVLQRHDPPARLPPSSLSSLEDPSQFDGASSSTSEVLDQAFNSYAPPASLLTPPLTSPSTSRSFQDLIEPDVNPTSKTAAEEDDFNMNSGSDPMFDFGDDVPLPEDDDDGFGQRKAPDSDDDTPSGAQSPHAGSLPIEIKWPGRKAQPIDSVVSLH